MIQKIADIHQQVQKFKTFNAFILSFAHHACVSAVFGRQSRQPLSRQSHQFAAPIRSASCALNSHTADIPATAQCAHPRPSCDEIRLFRNHIGMIGRSPGFKSKIVQRLSCIPKGRRRKIRGADDLTASTQRPIRTANPNQTRPLTTTFTNDHEDTTTIGTAAISGHPLQSTANQRVPNGVAIRRRPALSQ